MFFLVVFMWRLVGAHLVEGDYIWIVSIEILFSSLPQLRLADRVIRDVSIDDGWMDR